MVILDLMTSPEVVFRKEENGKSYQLVFNQRPRVQISSLSVVWFDLQALSTLTKDISGGSKKKNGYVYDLLTESQIILST